MGNKKKERKDWWDEECEWKKKRVRESLKRWRRKEGEKEDYSREKKNTKRCVRGKRGRKMRNGRGEQRRLRGKVWEIVNNERRRRRRIDERIGMNEWREHYMRLLGGVKERVVRESGREEEVENREEEIDREEIRRIRNNIKEGKAGGINGIPGEVWKHEGEELEDGYGDITIEYGKERDGRRGGGRE